MIHSFDASILARGKTSPRVLCGYMSLVDQLIGSAKPTSLLDRQGSAKLVKARVNCEPAARFPQRPTPSKRPRFQYLGVLCTAKRLPVLSPSASRSVRSLLHAFTLQLNGLSLPQPTCRLETDTTQDESFPIPKVYSFPVIIDGYRSNRHLM